MFWPIKDDNPTSHTPIVTWVLIFICVLVFIWQSQLTQTESQITEDKTPIQQQYVHMIHVGLEC